MMKLAFIGEKAMELRHRAFTPGEVVAFDMNDPADAALYRKCRVLPWFAEPVEKPKRQRRVKVQA